MTPLTQPDKDVSSINCETSFSRTLIILNKKPVDLLTTLQSTVSYVSFQINNRVPLNEITQVRAYHTDKINKISFEVRLLAVVVEAADSGELRIPRIILHCGVTQASFFYFSVKMNS